MTWTQTLALIAAIATLGVVVAISAGNIQRQTAAIQAQVVSADNRAIADRAESAAARRALQESMNAFQAEMRGLGERQAHVEGLAGRTP